jgi:tetratricopeptide (TPR) repeat protein
MKRILLPLCIIAAVFTSLFSQQTADDILSKNKIFTVKLRAGTAGVVYREGFGFYAKHLGAVLTPYNNITGFDEIKFVDDKGDTLKAAGVLGIDKTADLVLVAVGEQKTEKILFDFSDKLKLNEKIFIIGVDPKNIDTVYSGVISDIYRNNDGIILYNYTATMKPGYEGGLVFNEQMKLIGLTKGLYRNNYFSGFIIPLQYAKNMLENNKRKIISFTDSSLYSVFNASYWRGIYAAEKGVNDYDEALNHFKLALQEKPKDINTYFQLGLTFGMKNQLDSSITYYKESVKLDPKFVLGYLNLSVAYIMKEKYDDAISVLKEAIKITTQFPKLHFYLAYSLMKTGHSAESIKSFKKSLELEPNDPDVLEQLSEAYYLNKKYRDAVKTANQALKLNPKATNAIYILGMTNLELGDKDEAMRALQVLDKLDKMKANSLLDKINGK